MNLFNMTGLLVFCTAVACFAACSMQGDEELATKLEALGFDIELEMGSVEFVEGDCEKLKGDPALFAQLKHVKTAVLSNIDNKMVSTISRWKELEKLELKSCKLLELDEIGQISSLESFSLESEASQGQEIDIEFLKLLPKLRRIYLKGKAITHFDANSLVKLRGLRFEDTSISDFSFLGKCVSLRGLVVKTDQMNVALSEISKLKRLDGLIISGPVAIDFPLNSNLFRLEISGVSRFAEDVGLERMSNLVSLTLKEMNVVFRANSFVLPKNIQNLIMVGTPNQDLSVLGKLKKLSELHVPVKGIADFSSGFDSLTVLSLNSGETTGIKGCREVRRLSIYQTSIAINDFAVGDFPKLEAIGLNSKQHHDFKLILNGMPEFDAEIRLIE